MARTSPEPPTFEDLESTVCNILDSAFSGHHLDSGASDDAFCKNLDCLVLGNYEPRWYSE